MSDWTHILGILKVKPVPCRTQAEGTFVLDSVLHHLPIVAGSEEKMKVLFAPIEGHNYSSSCDELGQRTSNYNGDYHNFEVQSNYIISLNGNFRDTIFSSQIKVFTKWLYCLSSRIYIHDMQIRLYSDYGEQYQWIGDLGNNMNTDWINKYLSDMYSDF